MGKRFTTALCSLSLFYFSGICFAEAISEKVISVYCGEGAFAAVSSLGKGGQHVTTGTRFSYRKKDSKNWFLLGIETAKYAVDSDCSMQHIACGESDAVTAYGGLKHGFSTWHGMVPYVLFCVGAVQFGDADAKIKIPSDPSVSSGDIVEFTKTLSGGTDFVFLIGTGIDYVFSDSFTLFAEFSLRYGAGSRIFSLDEFGVSELKPIKFELPVYFGFTYSF